MSAGQVQTCNRCRQDKPSAEFSLKDKRCRPCKSAASLQSYHRRKARMEVDPEYAARIRENQKTWRRNSRDVRYGVPEGTVDALFEAQNGRCAACKRTADEVACAGKSGERLHVDHCHATGKVRGLLCKKCNSALGFVDDDIDRLRALIAYLEASR